MRWYQSLKKNPALKTYAEGSENGGPDTLARPRWKKGQAIQPTDHIQADFLPALLASICAMEKKSPQEMVSTKCLLIDTSWIEKSKTIAAVGEKRAPKEHAEYMELMKVLSASKLRMGFTWQNSG